MGSKLIRNKSILLKNSERDIIVLLAAEEYFC